MPNLSNKYAFEYEIVNALDKTTVFKSERKYSSLRSFLRDNDITIEDVRLLTVWRIRRRYLYTNFLIPRFPVFATNDSLVRFSSKRFGK